MATEVMREEFETRIGMLEREVQGEKMVTLTSSNKRDKVCGIGHKLDALIRDLPKIVTDAVREAYREGGKK